MKKRVYKLGIPAREEYFKGAETMADAVRSTLGPFGYSFDLDKGNETTTDGVTVGREMAAGAIHDEIQAKGARRLLEAATKAEERGIDGTTTATILAYEITKEAMTRLPTLGSHIKSKEKRKPAEVKLQIEKECAEVIEKLNALAVPVRDEKSLIKSALVSVSDPILADLIGKTQFLLGPEGYILPEETANLESSVERVDGIRTDKGIVTSLAINNMEKQALELSNIHIIVTDAVVKDLRPAFRNINLQTGRGTGIVDVMEERGINKVILLGQYFEPLAIRQCMENQKNGMEIYPVNAPWMDQKEIMKDLIAIAGGTFISSDTSSLEAMQWSDVGYLTKFIATRYNSTMTGLKGPETKKRIAVRIEELKTQYKGSVSDFEKKLIDQRIAQLTNGFAILKVGSITEADRKYLKRKADDAVGATRFAFQEGVVDGAGLAFKKISDELPEGYILKTPLLAIHKQIMDSAPEGFKIEKWVKDPVKVLRIALEHACSVASVFATVGGVICEEQVKPIDELFKSKGAGQSEE